MRNTSFLLASCVLVAACSGVAGSDGIVMDTAPASAPVTTATTPTTEVEPATSVAPTEHAAGTPIAMVDGYGAVALVDGAGGVTRLREGWRAQVSIDGAYAVSTALVGPGDTKVAWDALPNGSTIGGTVVVGADLVASATQVDGTLTALINPPAPIVDGTIAGGRNATTIAIASPDEGVIASYELEGNIVPEAFGRTVRSDGVPTQLFVLDYTPAEAPTHYRVRVLDTATGALSLPLNLRFKAGPPVDQQMAGVSRDQVLASDSGLLFTLYRGTSDMPDGHPTAFVHTLDLYDGVYCLEIDPALELEHLPGALAVHDGRLYVASANGMVGSYDIAAVTDPAQEPVMEWVTRVVDAGGEAAPAITAGPDGAVVAWPWMSGLHTVVPDGSTVVSTMAPPGVQALAVGEDGTIAIGDEFWTTTGIARPAWLGNIERVIP